MKKFLAVLIAVLTVFALVGCTEQNAQETTEDTATEENVAVDEAVTEEENADEETATDGQAQEAMAQEGADVEEETTPNLTVSNWSKEFYVDEFDDPTDMSYYRSNPIYGTFSNSATVDSNLMVIVGFDITEKYFRFVLYEYGNYPANFFMNDPITLGIKINGEASYYSLNTDGANLYLDDGDGVNLFYNALMNNEKISCVIDYPSAGLDSNYKFEIDGAGFKELVEADAQQ